MDRIWQTIDVIRRPSMHRWFLTLPLLLLPVVAAADTLVVATSGSDSAPCTADAPCRTIGQGLRRLASGDTLTIHGGTYDENNLRPPSGSTVEGASGERVVIRPSGGAAPGFDLDTASGATIRPRRRPAGYPHHGPGQPGGECRSSQCAEPGDRHLLRLRESRRLWPRRQYPAQCA